MKQFDWETFYRFTNDSPPWPLIVRAVSLLPHKGRALDLGAGAGRDTRYLVQQGFQVTAVDSDPHAVDILRSFQEGNVQVVQASFEDLRSRPTISSMLSLRSRLFPNAGFARCLHA